LARKNVSPNAISLGSIAFALFGGLAYAGCVYSNSRGLTAALLIVACVGIQGRLLCNLLDGMVAVEGGKGTRAGEIYNDAPDRVADVIVLVGAGYAAGGEYGPLLGWIASVVSLLTAYVRVLGRSIGTGIYFIGPMAKQHRMATLTIANVLSAILTVWSWQRWPLFIALVLITVGGVVTVFRRLHRIHSDLMRTAR
jgi:phosphatidylglycerophosphate synthase